MIGLKRRMFLCGFADGFNKGVEQGKLQKENIVNTPTGYEEFVYDLESQLCMLQYVFHDFMEGEVQFNIDFGLLKNVDEVIKMQEKAEKLKYFIRQNCQPVDLTEIISLATLINNLIDQIEDRQEHHTRAPRFERRDGAKSEAKK